MERLEEENRALREQVEKLNEWLEGVVRDGREEWRKAHRSR